MAFKKTNEGRVFFQGSGGNGGSANDGPSRPVREQQPQSAQGAPTQLQILALLRSLNEKLKATQVERNAMRAELDSYRRAMDGMQSRAAQGERAEKLAQETMKELEETRKLLLDIEERQAGIEKEGKANSEKIRIGAGSYRDLAKRFQISEKKQEEIVRKVEEADAQQARIMRQIEKAIEDRARFMRKIERIEETVVQTRDALNAKAMVLLTDQNIAGSVPADIEEGFKPPQEPGIPTAIPDQESAPGLWTNARGLQAAAILLLLVGAVLAGWAASEIRSRQTRDSSELATVETSPPSSAIETPAETAMEADAIVDKWSVSDDTTAFSENTSAPAAIEPDPSDDIGIDLADEKKIQQMLADDPDALAAELNKIEPADEAVAAPVSIDNSAANEGDAPAPQSGTATETETETETQIASLQPAAVETPSAPVVESLPEEIAPQTSASAPASESVEPAAPLYKKPDVDVRSLIDPDSNLPPAVKKIEDRAFEGMPEAQHDLAAVYTAGHGDVKQNFKRALFWFGQAADAGVSNAAYNLGVLNHQGLGTPADLKKAIEWYGRAADLGHPEAQYNLGIAYIEGVGVPYDPFKADAYFEKAAAHGITEASYNLGLIYENGLLGKPQPDRALVWYKDAADKGSPEAKAALEQLAKTLDIGVDEINKMVENVRNGRQPAAALPSQDNEERALLVQIQKHLMEMGLYPGPADGADSPLSQDAIRAYQKLNGMDADGLPSAALLVRMLAEDGVNASGPGDREYN